MPEPCRPLPEPSAVSRRRAPEDDSLAHRVLPDLRAGVGHVSRLLQVGKCNLDQQVDLASAGVLDVPGNGLLTVSANTDTWQTTRLATCVPAVAASSGDGDIPNEAVSAVADTPDQTSQNP